MGGRTLSEFIKNFLAMIAYAPELHFAYAQLGQENNFGWPAMQDAYPRQMKALTAIREEGLVHVETMAESGRRFKRAFGQTPAQAQVMLTDPFGNIQSREQTIWYQSRFYRANLHIKGDFPYLRDITVYSDAFPQPFLTEPTRQHDVEQRLPAVLDGYHWSGARGEPVFRGVSAGGFFFIAGAEEPVRLAGEPRVHQEGVFLIVEFPVEGRRKLQLRFDERGLSASVHPESAGLVLSFEWEPAKSALVGVNANHAEYRWQALSYSVGVSGKAEQTSKGWDAVAEHGAIRLNLAQAG